MLRSHAYCPTAAIVIPRAVSQWHASRFRAGPSILSMLRIESVRQHRPWGDWIEGSTGVGLAFLWGFAEGTLFFVVPDVLISLVALVRPRNAWRHIVAAIVGSLVAGIILFAWSSQSPQRAGRAVARVPLVSPGMFAEVDHGFRKHGQSAVLLGPLYGIPYKIYAVEAPAFVSASAFLWITVPARGVRFLVVWSLFGVTGVVLRRLRTTDPQLAAGHACVWLLIYSFYACFIHLR
jgi:membrane protein YqaA with SNARE-associated domain